MIKGRNTLDGEVLPFERKTELLVPYFKPRASTSQAHFRSTSNMENPNDVLANKYDKCLKSIGHVDALRNRKNDIEYEMEHLKQIIEHKQLCLAAGAYGGYGKLLESLHPALQQCTSKHF